MLIRPRTAPVPMGWLAAEIHSPSGSTGAFAMPLNVRVTRVSRRTLDVLLMAVIGIVIGVLVLARALPALTGGQAFVVGGGSMEPAIPRGAAVLAVPVAAGRLAVGDVVSLRIGDRQTVFTHRITRLIFRTDGLWLETKGDANREADPSLVPATMVVGRVEVSLPLAGYLVTILGSAQGIALFVSLAGFLLAGAWLLESLGQDQLETVRRGEHAGSSALTADGTHEQAALG